MKAPKVFISYSWTSTEHRDWVRRLAERLAKDGVEVVLDLWDLQEGQDKYSFMESMVSDDAIDHVLIISDQEYAEKADGRMGGVGAETQIITPELYRSAKQTKFIPVVTEYTAEGEATLPRYLRTRIFIDFARSPNADEPYEQLLRLIWDAPKHPRPALGRPPHFVLEARDNESLRTYSQREEAVDDMLLDIARVDRALHLYCRVYYSELVRRVQFERTIAEAVNRQALHSPRLVVRQVTTDPENEEAVTRLYRIEDPNAARWGTVREFQRHLQANAVDRLISTYHRVLQLVEPGRREKVRFECAYYDAYLSPYSFVLLDNKVLYASFHTLNAGLRFGRDMPTVRVTPREPPGSAWFTRFTEEIEFIETRNIARVSILGGEKE